MAVEFRTWMSGVGGRGIQLLPAFADLGGWSPTDEVSRAVDSQLRIVLDAICKLPPARTLPHGASARVAGR